MDSFLNYQQPTEGQTKPMMARPMTLREQLGERKARMEANLADVNEAIAALDSNPEILKALEAVQKVSRMM